MKKMFLFILASIAILLSGCGSSGSEQSFKSLITGNKFYYLDTVTMSNGADQYFAKEITFKNDGTVESEGSEIDKVNYTIKDNTISFTKEGENGSKDAIFIKKTDKGLLLKDAEVNHEFTLYFTKEFAQDAAKEKNKSQCDVDGDTVLVNEGQTCNYEDHTATCQDDKVTVDNSLTGKNVSIDGITYTCN